jgi:hypothetical protein
MRMCRVVRVGRRRSVLGRRWVLDGSRGREMRRERVFVFVFVFGFGLFVLGVL